MNIYVGNLSFDVKEENLQTAFEAFGQVSSATIVRDKYSGQPRGFGFVEMPDQNEARTAIANLNGKELLGRQMNVNEARPRPNRGGSGGPGGGPRGKVQFRRQGPLLTLAQNFGIVKCLYPHRFTKNFFSEPLFSFLSISMEPQAKAYGSSKCFEERNSAKHIPTVLKPVPAR